MKWAQENVKPVAIAERNAYHGDHIVDANNMVLHHSSHHFGDDAGQNARSILEAMRLEAARLAASAQAKIDPAIVAEAARNTKKWTANVLAQTQIDLGALLRDDDLVDFLSLQSEQANSLITSLSQDVMNRIERETLGAVFEGRSNADIAKSLQAVAGLGRNRARLIARDQASKLNAGMNEFRQRQAGISHYKWLGINDGRERPAHVARNNRIFSWDKPPADGPPGVPINCRCRALAVLDEAPEDLDKLDNPDDLGDFFQTNLPLIRQVAPTISQPVMGFTEAQVAERLGQTRELQQAIAQAVKAGSLSGDDAQRLLIEVYGFKPSDKDIDNLLTGASKLFSSQKSRYISAVQSRLQLIESQLSHANVGFEPIAPTPVAPVSTVITKADAPENGLIAANPAQVADWYKDTAKLDDASKSALNRYSTGMFDQINSAVRSDTGVPDWLKPIVGEIDAALDKGTVPQGSLLYRGVRSVIGFDNVNDAFKVGGTFSDQAFLSTSTDFTEAAGFSNGNNVVLVIDAGGKRGLPIGALSNFEYENEVLLERGIKFRVVADGRYVRTTAGKKLNVRIVKLVAI